MADGLPLEKCYYLAYALPQVYETSFIGASLSEPHTSESAV